MRRRICEASIDAPADLCRRLRPAERIQSLLIAIIAIVVDLAVIYGYLLFCRHVLNLSNKGIFYVSSVASVVMTLLMYVYFVFIVDKLYSKKKEN